MSDEYVVPSVICDEKSSKKDVESFSVLYDFLKNKEGNYINSQRILFLGGLSLIVVGISLFFLYMIIPFLQYSWFPIISISIVIVGAILLVVFFIRKPNLINIQKVYFPFSVCDLSSGINTNSIVLDSTIKMWNKSIKYMATRTKDIENNVNSLPQEITSYNTEVYALNLIRDINDDLRYEIGVDTNLPPNNFFKKIIPYAERVNMTPKHIIPSEDYEETLKKASEISTHLDRANENIEFLNEKKEIINGRVDSYIEYLKKLHADERDYMISYMGKFVDETIKMPEFFTPLINDFREDIRDYQLMIKRLGDREISDIKGRVQRDLSSIQKIINDMSTRIENNINDVERRSRVGRAERERIGKIIAGIHGMKESMLRDIIRARRDLEKTKEIKIRTPSTEESIKNMVFWWGSREKNEEKMEIVKNELKIYEVFSTQFKKKIENIEKNIKSLFTTLNLPIDKPKETLRIFNQKIQKILENGRRDIEKSSKTFEEDYSRIMRHVSHIEGIKGYVEDIIGSSQKFLEEEMKRHLKPFEERMESFDTERNRVNKMFDEIVDMNKKFIESIKSLSFKNSPNGVYMIPYWIISYDKGGRVMTWIYPISEFYGSSLRIKFKEINVEKKKFLSIVPSEFSEGIDRDLISDITLSSTAYKNIYGGSFLDRLIVLMGVRKIAK